MLILASSLLLWAPSARCELPKESAQAVGLWQAIDDKSHKVTSLIRLSQEGDTLVGRIETLYDKGLGSDPICGKCTGDRANRPLVGMAILWGLKVADDGYDGGYVLDPSSGATYRCKIKLTPDGALQVRGYLGISAFGRTQVWQRAVVASKIEAIPPAKSPKANRHDAP